MLGFLDGDARIESCGRVDLTNWTRLPVSTVFYEGQTSPGSPRSVANNSVMRWPNWPAIRSLGDDWRIMQQLTRDSLFVGPQPIAAPSRPIEHLVARDTSDGNWQIAISDGHKFQPTALSYWSPRDWTHLVSGDFNGDGMADLLGQFTDGTWWLGLANGNSIEFQKCPIELPEMKIDYVGVGDFNGDGLDDLAIRSADGQWWIGLSDGRHFTFPPLDSLDDFDSAAKHSHRRFQCRRPRRHRRLRSEDRRLACLAIRRSEIRD